MKIKNIIYFIVILASQNNGTLFASQETANAEIALNDVDKTIALFMDHMTLYTAYSDAINSACLDLETMANGNRIKEKACKAIRDSYEKMRTKPAEELFQELNKPENSYLLTNPLTKIALLEGMNHQLKEAFIPRAISFFIATLKHIVATTPTKKETARAPLDAFLAFREKHPDIKFEYLGQKKPDDTRHPAGAGGGQGAAASASSAYPSDDSLSLPPLVSIKRLTPAVASDRTESSRDDHSHDTAEINVFYEETGAEPGRSYSLIYDKVMPDGSVLPTDTVLPNGTVLPAGTVLPDGTALPAGTIIKLKRPHGSAN
jgi:hypothetical protein